uniref:Uncharacterized protein n=1 Tax=Anguilla anguilla TaxID=7936 RepID=A0A0E9VCT8_ANGAN
MVEVKTRYSEVKKLTGLVQELKLALVLLFLGVS